MNAGSEGATSSEVLDLTNEHLHSLEKVQLNPQLRVLDLTANRLSSIDPRILTLTGLVSVNFRQNLLTDVSAWAGAACKGSLEDLEFRDNQLKEIPALPGFSKLRRLEFSYNEIHSIEALAALGPAPIQELYLAANKIPAITGISQLSHLTTLELGSNRIKNIENLESQALLRELWLGRNRISTVQGLGHMKSLRCISLQSNRLESMLGFEACTGLEELYLSHNGIWRIEGLEPLKNLKILDVSNNRISKVEGLESQTQLEDLWLNDNAVPSLDDDALANGLKPVTATLTVIYLEGNPAAQDPAYEERVRQLLPKLKQLDSKHNLS
eukprot:CAMPEP_0202341768 /NCGR_PEP_ID=MMETSP1126-20121109/2616_1 /ASSEMBLY_ACC=CAM_ASM_000457 /TAXON_ID=3047 /ORGANISM="Dunaliella tertiolecta, Strain CCMP1320" /LENGTH=325 /DNA_ID=CAMNT_0048932621 /DNA_START=81 /DNA_END=1058 /DNA_ORIENTATION=+